MNTILLVTVMCSLGLVHGYQEVAHSTCNSTEQTCLYNRHPCLSNYDNNAYYRFYRRHILQQPLNKRSPPEQWTSYLKYWGLCDRPNQTFFKKQDELRVVNICNGQGWSWNNGGNLCNSHYKFEVYHIQVINQNTCAIDPPQRLISHVTVACDRIADYCLPVHFHGYSNQRPGQSRFLCQ